LAVAFAVSWLADGGTRLLLPSTANWVPIYIFPVSQTAIIGRVFLSRRNALALLALVVGVALFVVLRKGVTGPDVILYSTECVAVLWIVSSRPELPYRLRLCLAVYFGVGLLAWLAHVRWLAVVWTPEHHGAAPTWYPYQAARCVGLLLFCWAALKPTPSLRLSRS
jgi:hypothetical protein